MRVLTVSSKSTPGLERYLASCRLFGIEPQILGMGEPFAGLGTKLLQLRNALREMPDDELVLFSDSWDVVFLRQLDDVPRIFDEFGAPVVFSAEPHFLYLKDGKYDQWKRYPVDASVGLYRFLNSGAWVGRAGHVAAMFGDIDCPADANDDQTLVNEWFIEHPEGLVLDHDQKLFASTIFREGFESADFEIVGGRFRHRGTGTTPCLIHFGGENPACSKRVLSMLPFEVPQLPVSFKARFDYAVNIVCLRVLYALKLFPYPHAVRVKRAVYGAAAATLVAICLAAVMLAA